MGSEAKTIFLNTLIHRYECSAAQTHMCGLYPLQRSICSLEQCPRALEPKCSEDESPLCAEEVHLYVGCNLIALYIFFRSFSHIVLFQSLDKNVVSHA